MSEEQKRYQLTITLRIWDSKNGQGIGFDETTAMPDGDFEALVTMMKAFHELALKFSGGK